MKYLLLKHYRGGPAPAVGGVPMDRWTPEEVDAHMRFMHDFAARSGGDGGVRRRPGPGARGGVRAVRRRGAPTGDRRAVRRDQGPRRRLDGHRRGVVGARGPAGRGALRRAWGRRRADPRVARGAAVPHRVARDHRVRESLLRALVPAVLGVLVRRGAGFASAEDPEQEALLRAPGTRPDDPPRDPKAWLVAVAWRRFLDAARAEASRRGRELAVAVEPPAGWSRARASPISATASRSRPPSEAVSPVGTGAPIRTRRGRHPVRGAHARARPLRATLRLHEHQEALRKEPPRGKAVRHRDGDRRRRRAGALGTRGGPRRGLRLRRLAGAVRRRRGRGARVRPGQHDGRAPAGAQDVRALRGLLAHRTRGVRVHGPDEPDPEVRRLPHAHRPAGLGRREPAGGRPRRLR